MFFINQDYQLYRCLKREFIYGIFLIAVENGKTSAYSMVFCSF